MRSTSCVMYFPYIHSHHGIIFAKKSSRVRVSLHGVLQLSADFVSTIDCLTRCITGIFELKLALMWKIKDGSDLELHCLTRFFAVITWNTFCSRFYGNKHPRGLAVIFCPFFLPGSDLLNLKGLVKLERRPLKTRGKLDRIFFIGRVRLWKTSSSSASSNTFL